MKSHVIASWLTRPPRLRRSPSRRALAVGDCEGPLPQRPAADGIRASPYQHKQGRREYNGISTAEGLLLARTGALATVRSAVAATKLAGDRRAG